MPSIDSQGYCSPFDPSAILQRSQDLEDFFHDVANFIGLLRSVSDLNLNKTGGLYLLPRWRVQDIDTFELEKSRTHAFSHLPAKPLSC